MAGLQQDEEKQARCGDLSLPAFKILCSGALWSTWAPLRCLLWSREFLKGGHIQKYYVWVGRAN